MLTATDTQYIKLTLWMHKYFITLSTHKKILIFKHVVCSTEDSLLNSSNNKCNASTTENKKNKKN